MLAEGTVGGTFVMILVTSIASTGFWAFATKILDRRSRQVGLLLGMAHDRIIWLGMGYTERGWVTKDEYEDYLKYLVEPYSAFGGNGLADRVVQEVKKLPMLSKAPLDWRPINPYDRVATLPESEKKNG